MATNDQITRAARAIDPKADLSVSGGDVNTIVWENGYAGINIDTLKTKITEIEADDAKNTHQKKRKFRYPPIGDQLDDLYKQGAFSAEMSAKIKKVKDDNPKP